MKKKFNDSELKLSPVAKKKCNSLLLRKQDNMRTIIKLLKDCCNVEKDTLVFTNHRCLPQCIHI